MAVADSDLTTYLSANHPTDDSSTSGGAIDTAARPLDTQIPDGSPEDLDIVSDDAGDTMNFTLTYRATSGAEKTATGSLSGTTAVTAIAGENVERIQRISLDSAPSGNVTLDGNTSGTTYHTLNSGETLGAQFFENAESQSSQTTRYQKGFVKNETGDGSSLDQADLQVTADPDSSQKLAVEDAKDDNESVTDRTTQPSGITADGFVDDNTEVSVPTDSLGDGEAIGFWLELTRAADASAVRSTVDVETNGQTV